MSSLDSNHEEHRCENDAVKSDGNVLVRLTRIEEALKRESWLPIGLRGLLAMELPAVRKALRQRGRYWKTRAAKQVLALALASWLYGPSFQESETVSQLRVLDLELNASVEEVLDGSDADFED